MQRVCRVNFTGQMKEETSKNDLTKIIMEIELEAIDVRTRLELL